MRRIAALVLSILVLFSGTSLAGPATRPAGTVYADRYQTLSVTAAAPWAANETLGQSSTAVVLGLGYAQFSAGGVMPSFIVLLIPSAKGPVQLDSLAAAIVDNAKKQHPDQGDKASIAKTKLDGEDARVVTYLLDRQGRVVRLKGIVARHNQKVYLVQFFCLDSDFADLTPVADEVFASFRWSPGR